MPDEEELRAALELLESVARDRASLDALTPEERARFLQAAGAVFEPDVEARRRQTRVRRRQKRERTEDVLDETGIRQLRARPVFTTPNVFPPEGFVAEDDYREVIEPQHCYICKDKYSKVHHFYDQLCPPCAELNWAKRTETADLAGRVALLTGGRVKIGYQAGIKLLRAGAELIVTTRFPRDSAARYAAEPDFDEWGDRLTIFGLDLRHTPSVEAFCAHLLATRDRLDFIVNNACQTVRRPPAFYRHMLELEAAAAAVPELLGEYHGRTEVELVGGGVADPAALSQLALLPGEDEPQGHLFPEGRLVGATRGGSTCSKSS